MKWKVMGRREAVNRLTKLVAGAAGLSTVEMSRLLASVQGQLAKRDPEEFEKLVNIKASTLEAKILKILIFPRQDIFQDEFGRAAIFQFGDFPGGSCKDLVSIGSSEWALNGNCDENLCDRQNCSKLTQCFPTNECGSQTCPNLKVPGNSINNMNLYSAASLERIKNDPFVAALSKWFGAVNSQALSAEVLKMVTQRRMTMK
jgi:hypothetical protein